jgi:hypothetical protein
LGNKNPACGRFILSRDDFNDYKNQTGAAVLKNSMKNDDF